MSSFLSYRNASANHRMSLRAAITTNSTTNPAVAARAGRADADKSKPA
jgi:hypothetical protein